LGGRKSNGWRKIFSRSAIEKIIVAKDGGRK
jgi:hypothetical protein